MRIGDFIKYDLWRTTGYGMGRGKKVGYGILKTIVLVIRGFGSKKLNIRANALSYSMLLAIVPILAMVLAIAKGFGFGEIIQEHLNNSFLAETNIVPTIMEFVERYLDTAQGGAFIGIGLLILIVAIYLFFRQVEMAFNEIWTVKQSRAILRQLMTYITILFLIPILIIVSSGLSIFLQTASTNIPQLAFLNNFRSGFILFFQFVVVWITFTFMYKGIPNTRVHLLSALIPGILIGSLFQAMQMLSVYIIVWLGRTSIVYGAFASIPILLTFFQWGSLLILIGAEMSYAIQNNEEFEYEHDLETMSRRYKDYVTLYLLYVIINRFNNEEKPLTAHEIAVQEQLPIRLVNQLTSRLVETGVLSETWVENREEPALQPALDTHKMTISLIIDKIDQQGSEEFIANANDSMKDFWTRFVRIRKIKDDNYNILISEI